MSLSQVSPFYILWLPRYSPDKILKVRVNTARLEIRSRSHHDVANPLSNIPEKYQLQTCYIFSKVGHLRPFFCQICMKWFASQYLCVSNVALLFLIEFVDTFCVHYHCSVKFDLIDI